jgi:AhpD family alkylhydroperoxidase
VFLSLVCTAVLLAADPPNTAGKVGSVSSLAQLDQLARDRMHVTPRLPFAAEDASALAGFENLEPAGSGRIPNYLRALGPVPGAVKPLSQLVKTVLYSGQVQPEVKMAMGLRVAQIYGSGYVAAHTQRFLRGSRAGENLLHHIASGTLASLPPAPQLALRYADQLTRDIHGVGDADFREVRGYFNDSQIVELTLTVCFFNYFTRFVEALNLPVEPWALNSPFTYSADFQPPAARVGLISNEQMEWAAGVIESRRENTGGRAGGAALGLANSMRAMNLSPQIAQAWRAYGSASRQDETVSREIKLHVSFAVSMANGCRYCTLHQVQGLRRLDVSPTKLMQMKKDDSALTPRELAAVVFARKLTRDPAGASDADYEKLRAEFGEQGALEVVLQTCTFAFMNRFTDGLHLPSEDEAIRIYREVYGADFGR